MAKSNSDRHLCKGINKYIMQNVVDYLISTTNFWQLEYWLFNKIKNNFDTNAVSEYF